MPSLSLGARTSTPTIKPHSVWCSVFTLALISVFYYIRVCNSKLKIYFVLAWFGCLLPLRMLDLGGLN